MYKSINPPHDLRHFRWAVFSKFVGELCLAAVSLTVKRLTLPFCRVKEYLEKLGHTFAYPNIAAFLRDKEANPLIIYLPFQQDKCSNQNRTLHEVKSWGGATKKRTRGLLEWDYSITAGLNPSLFHSGDKGRLNNWFSGWLTMKTEEKKSELKWSELSGGGWIEMLSTRELIRAICMDKMPMEVWSKTVKQEERERGLKRGKKSMETMLPEGLWYCECGREEWIHQTLGSCLLPGWREFVFSARLPEDASLEGETERSSLGNDEQ